MVTLVTWSKVGSRCFSILAPQTREAVCPKWRTIAKIAAHCSISSNSRIRKVITEVVSFSTLTARKYATSRSLAMRTQVSCLAVLVGLMSNRDAKMGASCSVEGQATRTIRTSISSNSRWMAWRAAIITSITRQLLTSRRHFSRRTSLKAIMRVPTTLSATSPQTQSVGPTLSSSNPTTSSPASARSQPNQPARSKTWPRSRTLATTAISRTSALTSLSTGLALSSYRGTTLATTTSRPIGSSTLATSK